LIVAQDVERRQSLANAISSLGSQCQMAANCLEATQAFSKHPFDTILLDLSETVLDSAATARLLRSLETGERRVRIFSVSPAQAADQQRQLAAGVDGFFSTASDVEALDRLLRATPAEPVRPRRDLAAAARRASSINLQAALARLGGDESLLADLIQFFFEDAFGILAAMHAAIDKQSWEEARRAAHSLKGLSSNFSAAPAVNILQAIENCDRDGETSATAQSFATFAADADEEVAWLAAALAEYSADTCEGASKDKNASH
jgi:CheY-like chemotaxis protein